MNGENCRALQDWLTTNQMLQWLTKDRTVLVIKDREKGIITTNFRPITCLLLGDELYEHLEKRMGVNETAKGEKTGPEMTWVDNKKTNAMIPLLWIIKCLRIFGAAEKRLSLLEKV